MMLRSIFAASAALLMGSVAANAAQVAALIGGDTIATVDTAQKKATGSVKVSGISGKLVGIDVRPADGLLYARELRGRVNASEFAAANPDKDGTLDKGEYLAIVEQRFIAANPDNDWTIDAKELASPAGRKLMRVLK